MRAHAPRDDIIRVRVAGPYPLRGIERLIRDLTPLLTAREPISFEIDLSGLVFVTPAAAAILCATVNRLRTLELINDPSTLVPPVAPQVNTYLKRIEVLDYMLGDTESSSSIHRRSPLGFRPCMHFGDEAGHVQVVRHMAATMEESVEVDAVGRWSLATCLSELCENVLHHADAPDGGYAAAQTYVKKRGEVEVAIVDLGQGIRESLTKNPEYADIQDDVTAIQTAMEQHVTATPERNGGIGLFITRRLLRANGGRLVIRSGDGLVYDGAEACTATLGHLFPGTLIALVARTDRALDMGSVYRSLGYEPD